MMKTCQFIVVCLTMLATISSPMFGQGYLSSDPCCGTPVREYRLKFNTIYEEKPYTTYRLQTQTVLEERPVVTYKPVYETEMRERRYRVTKPVAQTSFREERRTVMRPVYETNYREVTYQRTRMVSETQSREERRTVMKPVVETQTREEYRVVQKPVVTTQYHDQVRTAYRPETKYHQQVVDQGSYYDQWSFTPATKAQGNKLQILPRSWFKNKQTGAVASQRPGAYWVPREVDRADGDYQVQRMYVPNPVTQHVATTSVVPYQYTEKVPVPVTQLQAETQVRRVPVHVTKYQPEEQVRRVPVTVQRPVVEQKVERIPYRTVRWVPEEQRRQVPVTTYRYVSEERVEQIPVRRQRLVAESRTVQVPKTVSNWVQSTQVRRVPRTMVTRIPINNGIVIPSVVVPSVALPGVVPSYSLNAETALPIEATYSAPTTSSEASEIHYQGNVVEGGIIPGVPIVPAEESDNEPQRGVRPEIDGDSINLDDGASLNAPGNAA